MTHTIFAETIEFEPRDERNRAALNLTGSAPAIAAAEETLRRFFEVLPVVDARADEPEEDEAPEGRLVSCLGRTHYVLGEDETIRLLDYFASCRCEGHRLTGKLIRATVSDRLEFDVGSVGRVIRGYGDAPSFCEVAMVNVDGDVGVQILRDDELIVIAEPVEGEPA